jgi:hypothetical protein
MSQNLTIEIPESEASRLKSLLEDWLALMSRMEAERPAREAEEARLDQRFRENMDIIWARIKYVGNAH